MAAKDADFTACRARLDWVERGIQDLNDRSRRHALILDGDGDGDGARGEDDRQVLLDAAILASNLVHQMRSSLDNLVRQLVRWNGATPSRANAFPVWTVDNRKARKDISYRLQGVAEEHVGLIEACQPYREPDDHPLAFIHELWNADKHDVLALISAVARPVSLTDPTGTSITTTGFQWAYDEGMPVVYELRRSLAYVLEVVDGFRVLTTSGILVPFPTFDGVTERFRRLQASDPSTAYMNDMQTISDFIGRWGSSGWTPATVPLERLAEMLAAVDRVLEGPAGPYQRFWLQPFQEKLIATSTARRRNLT